MNKCFILSIYERGHLCMLLNEMKRSELKTFTHTYIHASVNTIRAPSNYVDYHKCVHLYTTA